MAAAVSLAGGAAAQPSTFAYSPQPRWTQDPDTDIVCEAIRAECTGLLKKGSIDAEWSYEEVYDPDGMLVGMRSVRSTGCKPLDEHLLLDHRHFATEFSEPGKPDLDDITAELAPGTSKHSVRLIKRGTTQVSIGC